VSVVTSASQSLSGGSTVNSLKATCPSGTVVIAGGFLADQNNEYVIVTRSTPNTTANAWEVSAKNTAMLSSYPIQSYAVCMRRT
jgi:hypothetical protein